MSSSHLFLRTGSVRHLVCAFSFLALLAPLSAQEVVIPDTQSPELVISASRIATSSALVPSSVTVITADDLQRQQIRTLADALQNVPGLFLVQSGGIGGQSSIFMRGTNSNHTKVLIDGLDMSDPSTPSGSPDIGPMLASDIERIEILRGPQSGLYGSDAVGGVISITTKKGVGAPKVSGQIEGGSFGTFNQNMQISGSQESANYFFSITHNFVKNEPVTPAYLLQPGQKAMGNYYDNWTYASKVGADLSDVLSVSLTGRVVNSKLLFTGLDYNYYPATYLGSQQSKENQQQVAGRAEATWLSFDNHVRSVFGAGYTRTDRSSYDPVNLYSDNYFGDRSKIDWRSYVTLAPGHVILIGAENETEYMRSDPPIASISNLGSFAEYQFEQDKRYYLVANIRNDRNQVFGDHQTWRIAPAFITPITETKLKASYGTSFKAPSLYQLYGTYPAPYGEDGNAQLKPEVSRGYEYGFEQPLMDHRFAFGVTYFKNTISNLIENLYNSTTTNYYYDNVSSALTHGEEMFVSANVTDAIKTRLDYTHTLAIDQATGIQLSHRPKDKISWNVTWAATEKLSFTTTMLHSSSWLDQDRLTLVDTKGAAYTTFNLAADYKVTEQVSAFARIDNLLNKTFENPVGFQHSGFAVYGGVRVSSF